jgi:hypothetical protein
MAKKYSGEMPLRRQAKSSAHSAKEQLITH